MNNLPNIGIVGKMGAGKTTIAKYLEENYGYKRASLADPMREIVQDIFGVKEKSDPRYRRLMQKLGTEWFRSEDEDVWIRHLLNRCEGQGWVVDDVRFPNEARILLNNGWILIYVYANKDLRIERMKTRGDTIDESTFEHQSEAQTEQIVTDIGVEAVIYNGQDIEYLHKQIDRIMVYCCVVQNDIKIEEL